MVAWIPLLFAIIGILMYALGPGEKIQKIGISMFHASWIALMFSLASRTIQFLR